MRPYRIIYIGTGNFIPTNRSQAAYKILEALCNESDFEVPFVITGKDKPSDRNLHIKVGEIKQYALRNNKIVYETDHLSELGKIILEAAPHFILVVAFGEIISKGILDIPSIGSVNIHPSLLPKHRGPSPIQQAILEGETETGITWIKMSKKMDAGKVIAVEKIPVMPDETSITLSGKLSEIAALKTTEVLKNFAINPKERPQDESKATYTRKLQKSDGAILFMVDSAEQICRKIRAYSRWPGSYFFLNRTRYTVIEAEEVEHKISSGEILASGGIFIIGTNKNALRIKSIQPEGKRIMSAKDFLNGLKKMPRTVDPIFS